MIADLHCHFPMHLVHGEIGHLHDRVGTWVDRLADDLGEAAFDVAAALANRPPWGRNWRVDLPGLRAGGVDIVCSVLYWPPAEFTPGVLHHHHPGETAFAELVEQLDDVERALEQLPPEQRPVVVRRAADLAQAGTRIVHCVEGGFHLGPDPAACEEQVRTLADRGVFYITLAHLLYRGVATNAPALPPIPDSVYRRVWPQQVPPLSELGRSAVRAMCAHKLVVDVSHMREDAIAMTLDDLDACDPGRTLPVIASHAGARSADPDHHEYNLSPEVMSRIAERDGVIGIILAQHLLGETADEAASRALIEAHIDAIHDRLKSYRHIAIGTDLDGFINPTLAGIEHARDMTRLSEWIHELYPAAAEMILHENAERVLETVYALRGT